MSFRVKTTHQLLQNNPPPKQENSSMSFFDHVDEKSSTYMPNFLPPNNQQKNAPAQSSTNGMAIRTITSAQADHM